MLDFLWVMPFNIKKKLYKPLRKQLSTTLHLNIWENIYILYFGKFIINQFYSKSVEKCTHIINVFFVCLLNIFWQQTVIKQSKYRESNSISLKYLMQPTEGGWSGGESMRGWGGMWIEWTRVWDSCCCYDVPLDSSWLVSLTEEVSASFIISWREKKTYYISFIIAW